MTYTVVILYHRHGHRSGSDFFDSPTRSGASKRAKSFLRKETFCVVTKTRRLDNYDYWFAHDTVDLDNETRERYDRRNNETVEQGAPRPIVKGKDW